MKQYFFWGIIFFVNVFKMTAGAGGYVKIENHTPYKIYFEPENSKGCWKNIANLTGSVNPKENTNQRYFEKKKEWFSDCKVQMNLYFKTSTSEIGYVIIKGANKGYSIYDRSSKYSFRFETSEVLGKQDYFIIKIFNDAVKLDNAKGNNWLSFIEDNTPLGKITFPGTHDSGMDTDGYISCATHAKTQTKSILEQLEGGIRYLDIRLRNTNYKITYGGTFWVVHGICNPNKKFDTVLNDCKSFLKNNPNEVILMRLKEEGGEKEDFIKVFNKSYRNYPGIAWYGLDNTGAKELNKIPLNDVRGKIIVIDDSPSDGSQFQLKGSYQFERDNGLQKFKNHRFNEDNPISNAKRVIDLLQRSAAYNAQPSKKALFYIDSGASKISGPEMYARDANNAIVKYLTNYPAGSYGVFGLDFPFATFSVDLVHKLIMSNRALSK